MNRRSFAESLALAALAPALGVPAEALRLDFGRLDAARLTAAAPDSAALEETSAASLVLALVEIIRPEYGSRLIELIGQLNNETTRNLARLFTIQAVRQEARVRDLLELSVQTVPGQPDAIRIAFSVLPVADDEALALALEVVL